MSIDTTQALVLIERAERETPFCDCGEPMTPVAHRQQLWLECIAQPERSGGRLRRVLASVAAAGHTRRLILDPA